MRSVLRSRSGRAAVAVPALLLVLAACGADETTPVGADPASGSTASGEPSESVVTGDEAGSGESPEDAEDAEESGAAGAAAVGQGAGSWDEETLAPAMLAAMSEQETSRFRMTTTGGGADIEARGVMSFRGRTQDLAMTMSGATLGAERMELRVVDDVVYLSMPPMTPKGKYLEIGPDDTSSPFAGMMDQMRIDPRDSVKAFEAGLREVEFLGVEQVAGEELEQYRLTVDFASAAKAQGLPPMHDTAETVEYDLWLDEDALMRRMAFDVMQVGLVMEMSDWGEPVTIEPPPDRQITSR